MKYSYRPACFVFVCLIAIPLVGLAEGITIYDEIRPQPSHLKRGTPEILYSNYRCVDASDGSSLDCLFSHRVLGLKAPGSDPENNGGHLHDAGRPFVLDNGALEFIGDLDPSPLVVVGSTTSFDFAVNRLITHRLPEVAGTFEVEVIFHSPPGWFCSGACYTSKSSRYVTTYKVGVPDKLVELPTASDVYLRCARTSGCTTDSPSDGVHASVFYGTPELVHRVIGLAAVFRSITGEKLRITDMSLAKGGLLDIHANWIPPHRSHRVGNNADISRYSLVDNMLEVLDQSELDQMARNLMIRPLSESSKEECPALNEEQPPCIHLTFP